MVESIRVDDDSLSPPIRLCSKHSCMLSSNTGGAPCSRQTSFVPVSRLMLLQASRAFAGKTILGKEEPLRRKTGSLEAASSSWDVGGSIEQDKGRVSGKCSGALHVKLPLNGVSAEIIKGHARLSVQVFNAYRKCPVREQEDS